MRKIFIIFLVISILLIMISCASSPDKSKITSEKKGKAVPEEEYAVNTSQLQEDTEKMKKRADDIKAGVAMKNEYEKALAVYERALKEKEQGNLKKAVELFEKAKLQFENIYKKTEVKMARAEKSIEESKSDMQLVEDKVKEAGL